MARLALAQKIAAISLIIWKKEAEFDAQQLQRPTACASLRDRLSISAVFFGAGGRVLQMLGSRVSIGQ